MVGIRMVTPSRERRSPRDLSIPTMRCGSPPKLTKRLPSGVLADLHLDVLPIDSEVHDVGGEAGDVKVVLGVEVRDLHGEGVHVVDVAEGGLALGEGLLDVGGDFVDVLEDPVDRRGRDNEVRGLGDTDALLLENSVKPRRVDGVLLELVRLEELNKVLDGGTDLSPDFDLLEGEDETLPSVLTGGTLGEKVSELRVRKLVNSSVGSDGEITPNIARRLELDALDTS
mmetsp:Transcript_14161/g.25956  ORF Transcript_14161/g.25956 Transcript_14161/m.25956 type:complete len:227 (-) Transcript_14161:900-1580(-)